MPKNLISSESGVSMTEYVIATVLLAIVMLGAVTFLNLAAEERAQQSIGSVENVAPCRNLASPYGCM